MSVDHGRVLEALRDLDRQPALRRRLECVLGYDSERGLISTDGWREDLSEVLAEEPEFCAAGGKEGRFSVIKVRLAQSGKLSPVAERKIIERLRMQVGATVRGGYLRFKRQCVEQIPIPDAPAVDRGAISELVRKCLDAKVMGCEEWEAEIDERVVALYGLSGGS